MRMHRALSFLKKRLTVAKDEETYEILGGLSPARHSDANADDQEQQKKTKHVVLHNIGSIDEQFHWHRKLVRAKPLVEQMMCVDWHREQDDYHRYH